MKTVLNLILGIAMLGTLGGLAVAEPTEVKGSTSKEVHRYNFQTSRTAANKVTPTPTPKAKFHFHVRSEHRDQKATPTPTPKAN
jgi:hypothetical protein